MEHLWSLGGLSWRKLMIRTVRESWADNVFGQAARLAFYHFLALFPSLLLMMLVARPDSAPETSLRHALGHAVGYVLPAATAALMQTTVTELHQNAATSGGIWIGVAGALWAAVNGAWAMVDGLNVAYEVEEKRSWIHVTAIALAFTAIIAAATLLALAGGEMLAAWLDRLGFGPVGAAARWAVIAGALFICLAAFFRIGPNLNDRQWQWSTPGAVIAAALWIGETLVFRFWVDRFNSYPAIYGHLASVASLLVWLYITGATVLIGAEMNSEIEKAAAEGGVGREVRRAR